MLYSPYAHARIKSIDASAAEKMPGVKAVHLIAKEGTELRYCGDDIAAVAAETEEQATDAARSPTRFITQVLPSMPSPRNRYLTTRPRRLPREAM